MRYIFSVLLVLIFYNLSFSQSCFEAYDLLFAGDNNSLSYQEFHVLELKFLEDLTGCAAIDFNVTSMAGEEIQLQALKGKVVVLNFWFTSCLPCLKEIPELNKLEAQYTDDEVVFIGFARDNKEQLERFFAKFGAFNYKIIPESHAIADAYKVIGWPQSMVIDRKGRVYSSWAGLHESPSELASRIQKAINECLSSE